MTTEAALIAGVVLAGGRSERMGRDKAGIVWRGRTLLDRARELLRETGCATVVVVGRPDAPDGLADREPGAGPGRALLDALLSARAAELEGVLAIPVDMPLLTPGHLRPLAAAPRDRARCWRSTPLPAFLPAGLADVPRDAVSSVRSLLEAGRLERVEIEAALAAGLENVNTPADLARLGAAT